ncbi:MAG: T9SS type A sorting domain-containing protein [Ignavibacteria bacterium]|nr:T9SS type A sorting domain-containing protein [Ignavibacteria bacterium]
MNSRSIILFLFLLGCTVEVFSQSSQWRLLTPLNSGLPDSFITSIASDLQGNVWFGSFSGTVTRFDGAQWKSYGVSDGVPAAMITAIANDPADRSVWIGSRAHSGLATLVGQHWTDYPFNSCSGDCDVEVLAIDYTHTKWIGTRSDGLWSFDGSMWSLHSAPTGYTFSTVMSIATDVDSTLWLTEDQGDIGKAGYALFHYVGGNWIHVTPANSGLSDSSIRLVGIDHGDNKWFISDSSIIRYDGSRWIIYAVGDNNLKESPRFYFTFDSSNAPWILVDSSGTYWLQTLHGGHWDEYLFPVNPQTVWGIAVDRFNNKWIATSSSALEFNENGIMTDVTDRLEKIPNTFRLYPNYPNPFNPETVIPYELSENAVVQIKVFDILGCEAAVLVDQFLIAGSYETKFNGNNLASGTYFYRIQTENLTLTMKMILLR